MQVATLFRETATLLGASMEAQDPPGVETQGFKFTDGPPATCSPNPPRDWFQSGPRKEFLGENENYCKTSRPTFLDGPVKIETQDDGYETSGDLELRTQVENQKFMNHLQGPHPANIKCEPTEDPYSFVDDDPTPAAQQHRPQSVVLQPIPKKRGRKKKNCLEGGLENAENLMNGDPLMKKKLKEGKFIPIFKERKKHDRFNGMSEEEVSKRTLPDHLALNLDIVIIGINPGLFAAYKGHHYAGPGNHFWKCLYLSGLTPEPMTADDDYKLLQVGIGFTNMVARATKGSADLTRKEIKEGSQILLEKLQKFKPKIAVFNGKLIFEVFSGKKDFSFGRQPEFVDGTNTYMWVMPSSSARCAQLPRAADKVPFYAALKKFRDYLNGIITDLDETEVVFTDSKLKNYFEPELKDEPKEEHSFYGYGRMPNDELTDLSNAVMKKEDQPPAKKKRGRPKKIKSDCVEVKKTSAEPPKKEPNNVCEVPKKKRGRPKKIKTEDVMPNTNGIIDHTNSSTTVSNCFSPPIQSPSSYGQQNFSPSYGGHSHSYSQHPSQSPSEIHNYHHSPVPSQQHYTQSPQPPSQSFTHSDLSSEISAAISSEHNLGSPSPTSPSLGPPDFEPPSSMPEETNDGQQQSAARTPKEEVMGENNQNPNECRFSSPAPPNDSNNLGYPNYGNFQTSPDNHSVLGYTGTEYNAKRNLNQDVSSKSLSGLESLVDQIPSIADGEAPHSTIGNGNVEEQFSNGHIPTSQFNDNSGYLGGYSSGQQYSAANGQNSNNYSPHYTSSNSNYSVSTSNSYSLHHSNGSMNFSVTSLANSSTAVNHEAGGQVSSSFSVSSLASNYTPMNSNVNSYPNLIGAPHPMAGHVVSSANGMFGNGMSGGIMERACGMGSSMGTLGSPVGLHNPMSMGTHSLPYPYGQYSHSAPPYAGASGGSFQYPPAHSLHVPSPNYPYPSPYSNSTYPQPSYLPNHMLDRLKQDRMDIGFGSF